MPWLPPDTAHAADIPRRWRDAALNAFAAASPTARTLHADLLRQFVADADPAHLTALTRLACAMEAPHVWRRVQTLIREYPANADDVVVAAPWDDLQEDVRAVILECADRSSVCAAVAAARGRRDPEATVIANKTAVAFFAALAPTVWDALDPATQQRLRRTLDPGHAHLAVRALGLRPEILARATLTEELARAVHRHARGDAATLRQALFPVTLRAVAPAAAHALIAAMPTPPPDPGAFFGIACGRADPDVRAPACAALRTPADLAVAVTIQRCCGGQWSILDRSAAMHQALHGRSHDDLTAIMPLLDDAARATLTPDPDAIVRRLAHSDRQDALRRALDRLAQRPPDCAVPARFVLAQWVQQRSYAPYLAEALADALQAHGDVFLELADALADDMRQTLLPLPVDAAAATALRTLAQDDPVTARRLAHALHVRSWRDALLALLHAPPRRAAAVWQARNDAERQEISTAVSAAPQDANSHVERDPIAALALAALQSERDDLRNAGRAALAQRPDVLRVFWTTLPSETQLIFHAHPAVADLLVAASVSPDSPAACRRVRRRGA